MSNREWASSRGLRHALFVPGQAIDYLQGGWQRPGRPDTGRGNEGWRARSAILGQTSRMHSISQRVRSYDRCSRCQIRRYPAFSRSNARSLMPQTWKSTFVKMRFQLRSFDKRAAWLNDPANIV